ncbi:MAG: hypothetical protein M3416_10730 [Acidobacteriota bacterium]|nr:hypothetical protein [Acidobacteriota bacterium]
MKDRPTGIIRTLPYGPNHGEEAMRAAYAKMVAGLERLNRFDAAHVLVGMQQRPKVEVLHCYILVEGRIVGRAHIAGYEEGVPPVKCWDGSTRQHKFWAVLTGPYEPAPEVIRRRGFQGFRYTGDLW